jgi:21S rRNA (GM2251-2'-O)-methyltransferase
VKAALKAGRRVLSELLVQEGLIIRRTASDGQGEGGGRGEGDGEGEGEIATISRLAEERGLPVKQLSKHDLNMLSDSRPHQGVVLRAERVEPVSMPGGLAPVDTSTSDRYPCVLALDEVGDPMNLGALLRTAHFLGVEKVILCAKNSAPLSPVVSKASAGAMEVAHIASTTNMMRFLDASKENGWQIVGTALEGSTLPLGSSAVEFNKPTVLVLGNEGHGLRTNVMRRCDVLIKLSSGGANGDGGSGSDVDSLNVSVTGGILLHHIMSSSSSHPPSKE